jgi:hypothetical protein
MMWNRRNLYEEMWGFAIECDCGGVARIKDGSFIVDSYPRTYVCTECGKEHILGKR